ncbi:hypothetical protein [Pseudoramibacter faecis]|uniref:hypothetical protein n=1 Tax=Pseudoramibacter faecis TaxID=3108534 RepID=UPI002E792E75|nr:hypothetical protein [Pseudoramibacter sp. HA2172]
MPKRRLKQSGRIGEKVPFENCRKAEEYSEKRMNMKKYPVFIQNFIYNLIRSEKDGYKKNAS